MIVADLIYPKATQSSSSERSPWGFLDDYQLRAKQTDQNSCAGVEGLAFPLLGLFGEVGSLLAALKKRQRDKDAYVSYSKEVIEEFGDVLWYLSNVTGRTGVTFTELAGRANINPVQTNGSLNKTDAFEAAVINLGGKAGLVLDHFSTGMFAENSDRLLSSLAEVFSALIYAATQADVNLIEVAEKNLQKIDSRWPTTRRYAPLFDQEFAACERLPRKIEMHIVEAKVGDRTCVIQFCNGVEVGSRLTDNKLSEDDYRFHDVFHLAYAAILGWSPCLRALLKVKRKSRPTIDEAEDGARAILIEEGVSTMIFHHALRLNFFATVKSLDYSLLKTIHEFVSGYEVDQVPLWQWEQAILGGFDVFRKLRVHRRGVVIADLLERSIAFHPNDR